MRVIDDRGYPDNTATMARRTRKSSPLTGGQIRAPCAAFPRVIQLIGAVTAE
jgi:hypothetical protein